MHLPYDDKKSRARARDVFTAIPPRGRRPREKKNTHNSHHRLVVLATITRDAVTRHARDARRCLREYLQGNLRSIEMEEPQE